MADLSICVLGEPEVLWRGQSINIERRITRHILYYLASQIGPVNRAQLVNLFWGEKEESRARANLRQSLHRLRTAFPGVLLLKEQGDLVGINFNDVDVDIHQFSQIFDQIYQTTLRLPVSQPLPDEIHKKLTELDRLWHGTDFLGGAITSDSIQFEEWFNDFQYRLQHRRRWVLERLSDHAQASGLLQEALNLAGRALINNETYEDLHTRVLNILLRLNRMGEAKDYYKTTTAKFAREGIELSAEFRQRFDYLTNPATRPRFANAVTWNIYTAIQMPFVGRRLEFDILNQQFQAGGSVFLFGESGQGKTRLLQNFSSQAFPIPRIILAQARAGEIGLPYQPLLDALRRGIQPLEWLRLPAAWASHLCQVLPELSLNRTDLKMPVMASHEHARALFQEALRQLLLMITQNQRLLLIVDDSQWADEATLAALEFLVSRPPFDKNSLMIIAARVEEPNQRLLQMHDHMTRSLNAKTIHLDQLKASEITQLIQATLRMPAPAALVEKVARDSGGNPLYIGEILTSLAGQDLGEILPDRLPTSENLNRLIKSRLKLHARETQRVLEAAAVLGYEFSLADLSSTAQCTSEELSDALNELEASHLLQVQVNQNDLNKVRINFIHDKFREVQLELISPALKPALHRQAALSLHNNAGEKLDVSAAVIARHYEQAGDYLQAFQLWVRAGNYSLKLFSINEADLAFQRAAALIPECSEKLEDESIYSLFDTWGEMWSDRNETEILVKLGEQLLALGQSRQSDLLSCSGHHRLGNAAFTCNDFRNGLYETNLAASYFPKLQFPHLELKVYSQFGVLLLMAGQFNSAEEWLNKALDCTNNLHTEDPMVLTWMAELYYELGMLKTMSGWPRLGNENARHALSILNNIQNKNQLVVNQHVTLAGSLIGLTEHYMGQYIEASKQLHDTLEPAIQAGLWRVVGYLHDYIAMNDLVMGNLDEMLIHIDQATQIGQQYQRKEIYSVARQVLGDAFIRLQDFPKAHEQFALSLEKNQDTFLTPYLMTHLGYCEIAIGNIESGLNIVREAEKIGQEYNLGLIGPEADLAYFFYYSNTGNWEMCKKRANQSILDCEERNFNFIKVFAEYFSAISYIQTGEFDHGLKLLLKVADEAQAAQNFQAEILSRQSIALIMKKAGMDAAIHFERIKILLHRLETHAQSPEFRSSLQQLILNLTKDPGIEGLFETF